jgi:hypothetical protein
MPRNFSLFSRIFSCHLMVLQPVGEGWPLPPSPVHSLPLPRQIVGQVRLAMQNQKQIKYMLYGEIPARDESCFHIEAGYGKSQTSCKIIYHSERISIQCGIPGLCENNDRDEETEEAKREDKIRTNAVRLF